MPHYSSFPMSMQPQLLSWKLDGGGAQVLHLETTIKDGILSGGDIHDGVGPCLLGDDPKLQQELDLKRMIEELEEEEQENEDDDVVGDGEHIASYAVPSVFICPHLPLGDVMLCTGQTYDQANILCWFATGRLSCPTTMHDLYWSNALIPNATLRRLIHAWFTRCRILARKWAQDVQGRARALIKQW